MSAADLASGKGHKDENFPVASRLIRPRFRGPIMAFYFFARAADDISDNPQASEAEKLEALEGMQASLLGEAGEPTAEALAVQLDRHQLAPTHALDLLKAFTRDVTKRRYASWAELIDYCRVSAMPVGRFVLDVHGESPSAWPANDALCAALQIINHLQDCGKDYRALDRVYLPLDMMRSCGARVEDLGAAAATPGLRLVIAQCAERCQALLAESAGFAREIKDGRLSLEVAIIQRLAEDLTERLLHEDPLATRVVHRKSEAMGLAARAAIARMFRR